MEKTEYKCSNCGKTSEKATKCCGKMMSKKTSSGGSCSSC